MTFRRGLTTLRKVAHRALLGLLIGPSSASAALPETFAQDVQTLGRQNHRLTGTGGTLGPMVHLTTRLKELGVPTVLHAEFGVVQPGYSQLTTTLTLDGDNGSTQTIEVQPLRPNVVVPVSLDRPLTATLVDLGRGQEKTLQAAQLHGHIALLEYDSGDAWRQAFAAGAAAVVFLGSEDPLATPAAAKHAAVPLNLTRFYVDAPSAARVRTAAGSVVTLQQETRPAAEGAGLFFGLRSGVNIVAVIPGQPGLTDETEGLDGREIVVVAAGYDSFGVVPTRSPGARRAANVAGLLALAEQLMREPPRRTTVLLLHDASAQRHRGARHFYDALTMPRATRQSLAAGYDDEAAQVIEAIEQLDGLAQAVTPDTASDGGVTPGPVSVEPGVWLRSRLKERAEWARADVDRRGRRCARPGPWRPMLRAIAHVIQRSKMIRRRSKSGP